MKVKRIAIVTGATGGLGREFVRLLLKEKKKNSEYETEMRYSGGWGAAPAILSCIKVEDIGTLS